MNIGRVLRSIANAIARIWAMTSAPGLNRELTPPQSTGISEPVGAPTANQGESPAPTQAPAAWLLFQSGSRVGQSVLLEAQSVSIGRSKENDLVVEDVAMSRTHARITSDNGQYFIEDLGSMSGTLVDGSSVTKTLLTSGGSLKLGETRVVFMQAEPSSVPGTNSGPLSPGPKRNHGDTATSGPYGLAGDNRWTPKRENLPD